MHASMQPREQENLIPWVIGSNEDLKKFQQHLNEIVEGAAFRGSQRSAQFLTYVVEQAIAGQWNALKERTIGIELFGRSPTYNTGEDAIVRVTASDVRRRLLQHYGRYGAASEFRVSLPAGHYIPEIVREPCSVAEVASVQTIGVLPDLSQAFNQGCGRVRILGYLRHQMFNAVRFGANSTRTIRVQMGYP